MTPPEKALFADPAWWAWGPCFTSHPGLGSLSSEMAAKEQFLLQLESARVGGTRATSGFRARDRGREGSPVCPRLLGCLSDRQGLVSTHFELHAAWAERGRGPRKGLRVSAVFQAS